MSAYRARPASASHSSSSFAATSTRPSASSLASSSTSSLARTRPGSAKRVTYSSTQLGSADAAQMQAARRRRAAERVGEAEGELLAQQMHASLNISKTEKEGIVEALAAEQNGYLLMLLEKEQSNESERVRILAAIDDLGDQRRLEKIFAIERAKASSVIRNVTKQHERQLALKLHELGMISDDEDDEDL